MSSPRTTATHRSRLARRLAVETATGYQSALARVEQAAARGELPPRLDAAGLDLALRTLLQQDMEFWGPAAVAHPWPSTYHQIMLGLAAPMGAKALDAAAAASRAGNGQCAVERGVFDPSYLAALGVEPTVDGAPDRDEDLEDEDAQQDEDPQDRDLDEPDRWRRFVLADGPRPEHALPAAHQLPPGAASDDEAALVRLLAAEPRTVAAYVELGDLALGRRADPLSPGGLDAVAPDALQAALSWFECALAVGEQAIGMVFTATLPWRLPQNRPFLTALLRYAALLRHVGRLNAAELLALRLLWLDPRDEQRAASLLEAVRRDLGLRPAQAAAA